MIQLKRIIMDITCCSGNNIHSTFHNLRFDSKRNGFDGVVCKNYYQLDVSPNWASLVVRTEWTSMPHLSREYWISQSHSQLGYYNTVHTLTVTPSTNQKKSYNYIQALRHNLLARGHLKGQNPYKMCQFCISHLRHFKQKNLAWWLGL